jgi:hypothetical protein
MIDVLLESLPADAQARVRASHEFAFWHGHGCQLGGRLLYERMLLRLIEDEMDKMETARRERDRIIELLREGDMS